MFYRYEINVSVVVYKKFCDQTRICYALIFLFFIHSLQSLKTFYSPTSFSCIVYQVNFLTPLNSLGAGYKTGNKIFLVIWGLLNSPRPVACFPHEIPTGAIFLTYAPGLFPCLEQLAPFLHKQSIARIYTQSAVRSPCFIPSSCFILSPYFPVRVLYLVRISYPVRCPQSAVRSAYFILTDIQPYLVSKDAIFFSFSAKYRAKNKQT